MQHFFVTPEQVRERKIYIEGSDVNHMKNVLRMRIGEVLEVSDGNNHKYCCHIEAFEQELVVLEIDEEQSTDTELPSRICLFQGLPKGDKMELIIQKAVELGASEVIPVSTRRSIVKLDAKKAAKKVERWQEIARSAAKQSGRGVIPEVSEVLGFKEALEYAKTLDVVLIPYELAEGMAATKKIISQIAPGQSVAVFIGPEGGFSEEEIAQATEQQVQPMTLGKRILRTETAGLAVLSILMFHLEEN